MVRLCILKSALVDLPSYAGARAGVTELHCAMRLVRIAPFLCWRSSPASNGAERSLFVVGFTPGRRLSRTSGARASLRSSPSRSASRWWWKTAGSRRQPRVRSRGEKPPDGTPCCSATTQSSPRTTRSTRGSATPCEGLRAVALSRSRRNGARRASVGAGASVAELIPTRSSIPGISTRLNRGRRRAHLSGELLQSSWPRRLVARAYKGRAAALTDVPRGQV